MSSNHKFLEKFDQFVSKHKMITREDKILVGFSGGADSTALIMGLNYLRSKYNCSLLAAHINYNLRDEDSKADEEFVKRFCFDRSISLVIKNIKITKQANLENNAREIRLDYFNKLIKNYRLDKIALGHNKYDQAETILFRLIRGSGYTGLKGISPISGKMIHPLLVFTREEIEEFLRSENITWREDKTNQETKFTRNKIRHELIPWIADNLNSSIIDKLNNVSTVFAETDLILEELARRRIQKTLIKKNETDYIIALNIIRKLSPVLRFYIYRRIYSFINGDNKDFYLSNFEEIEAILESSGSKKVYLPNKVFVYKEYKDLIFSPKKVLKKVDISNKKEITSIRNRLMFEDYRIIMKKLKKLPHKRNLYEDNNRVYLDLDKINFPIFIRHRKPGDSFQPYGLKHTKKLKDFFIDEKISKFDRDKVLLFCDSKKIIWIAGLRIDNRVAITENTSNILQLKLEKMALKKARPAERIKKKVKYGK